MELAVYIDNLTEANRFLRCLWAEFRSVCGKCGFLYTPWRDGPKQRIGFGFADINRPEGPLMIGVTYAQKGTIRSVTFDHDFENTLDEESEFGQLVKRVVDSAVVKRTSPQRRSLKTSIECLHSPSGFYESESFLIEPISRRRFSLSLTVDAYDEIDSKTEFSSKMDRVLDVLSVETNSAYWPLISERSNPDKPLAKPNTARQVISTVSAKVFFKGGRPRCSGRFLANLDILRLTTRGLTRLRRGSSAVGPFPPAAIDTIGSDPAE